MNHALDPLTLIASLRGHSTEPFDPVGLHFLETLAHRTRTHDGAVRHLLEDKLRQALATYQERMARAHPAAHAGSPARQTALAELTRSLTQHVPKNAQPSMGGSADGSDASMGTRPELKSIRYFRDTWSTLSVNHQLARAMEQAPGNAGPLNSHQLVLRSLSVMRDSAPQYLNRFMSYADTLLWLDQVDSHPAVKSPPEGEGARKRKPGATRAR